MMIRLQAPRAASVAAACAVVFSLSAQADDASTVIITAARAPQALTDALPHTTVLTRTDIERTQAVDLAALLAAEAGLQLAANGGRGTATSLFVRGAPMRQVLVLVDGVPLSRQDATGQVGVEHLMLDQVERVEIVRGNVSALYGSGAVGGVVQVFTRRGGEPRLSLVGEGGARGYARASAQASGGTGATQWSAGLSAQRDRGLSVLDATKVPAANPDRDAYRNTSATLNLSHAWADGHTLSAGLLHTEGRLDYDSFFATPADVQRSRTKKQMLRLGSDDRLGTGWTSRLSLSTQRDDASYDETGEFGSLSRYRTTVDALNWSNELALQPGLSAVAGAELQRQRIDTNDGFGGIYDRARTVWAVFGGVQAALGAQSLSLNLRHDDIGSVGSRNSANVGWSWAVDPQWKLLASAGNAFSAPPLGYLHAPFFGNPALRPETSRSAEVGVQWAVAGQRLRATWFQTRVRDEIDYDTRTFAFGNIDRTRNRGLELSHAGRVASIDLRAGLTLQRPVDEDTGQVRVRRSERLASVSASKDLGSGWRVGLAARHAGARPEADGSTLAAYTVADLTAQWDFHPQGQWFARLENLGDAHYETAGGYLQPPRGLFMGLRWRMAL